MFPGADIAFRLEKHGAAQYFMKTSKSRVSVRGAIFINKGKRLS